MRLSDLATWEPLPGDATGICCVCGRDTDTGHRSRPSENFFAFDLIRGDVFCECCWALLKTRPARQSSWIATLSGLQFVTAQEVGEFLAAPVVPCAVHLTRGRRHQSWLPLGRRVSVSPDRPWVATDWAGPVLLPRDRDDRRLARVLLDRDILRSRVIAGTFSPGDWARAIKEGWWEDLERASQRKGDPCWEVWAYVA